MNLPSGWPRLPVLVALWIGVAASTTRATCLTCTPGAIAVWGSVNSAQLNEASGIVVSSYNPGVIWSHNDDGNDGRLFAFNTNGALLATGYTFLSWDDFEDLAVGPGPVAGASYLYLGDIGGSAQLTEVRSSVRVARILEPRIVGAPGNFGFGNVETFTLNYPDGSFDAETLMFDSISGDVLIGTKQNSGTRIYRVDLSSATNGETLTLQFVTTVPFGSASGGSISANGSLIALRRENFAQVWSRCPGESVIAALARPGQSIPVIGPPSEPNGEAIGFLPDGSGYVTISDAASGTSYPFPPINFFTLSCALTTLITRHPQSVAVEPGTNVEFSVEAVGTNLTYQWRFQNVDIPGATSATLLLTDVQPANAGSYSVTVTGDGGFVFSTPATLTVRILAPVISLQPQSMLAATGSTVQLSVAVQGTPPFQFLWSRNGRAVPSAGETLSFTNIQKTNAGKYRVVVTNVAGRATSAFAQLKVLNPPVFVVSPEPKTVTNGTKVVLRARAKGSPRIYYQWLFEGMPLEGATRPQLVLKGVQPLQSGGYSVSASNAVGTATSAPAALVVQ
jgi:hypothetical protein